MTRPLDTGDTVTICTPGAGGWNDPLDRDPQKVLWDVVEGFISPSRAENAYGVVIIDKGDGFYELDRPSTEGLRSRLKSVAAQGQGAEHERVS